LSHFKTLLLAVLFIGASTALAKGDCKKVHALAEVSCSGAHDTISTTEPNYDGRYKDMSGAYYTAAALFQQCDSPHSACLHVCALEQEETDNKAEQDDIQDMLVECRTGYIGQNHAMIKNAIITAERVAVRTGVQKVSASGDNQFNRSVDATTGMESLPAPLFQSLVGGMGIK